MITRPTGLTGVSAFLLLAASALLSGCGGGSSSNNPSGDTPPAGETGDPLGDSSLRVLTEDNMVDVAKDVYRILRRQDTSNDGTTLDDKRAVPSRKLGFTLLHRDYLEMSGSVSGDGVELSECPTRGSLTRSNDDETIVFTYDDCTWVNGFGYSRTYDGTIRWTPLAGTDHAHAWQVTEEFAWGNTDYSASYQFHFTSSFNWMITEWNEPPRKSNLHLAYAGGAGKLEFSGSYANDAGETVHFDSEGLRNVDPRRNGSISIEGANGDVITVEFVDISHEGGVSIRLNDGAVQEIRLNSF